jgi:hypothetical protein
MRKVMLAAAVVIVVAGLAFAIWRYLVMEGYVRYNKWDRRVRGDLREGGPAPDLSVARHAGEPVQLSRLWRERPLFLVFGSCT